MKKIYNVEEDNRGNTIIWFEEEGIRYSFAADPENRYYQDYLKSLENQDAEEGVTL